MDHTPFIAGAYAIGAIVLLWTAIGPLLKKKSVIRDICRLIQVEDRSSDS